MTESESVALPLGDAAFATHHIIAYPFLFVNTFLEKILFFLKCGKSAFFSKKIIGSDIDKELLGVYNAIEPSKIFL